MGVIREPAVAGAFYSDDPLALAAEIRRYVNRAAFEAIEGDIVGVISPHAGYVYSGQVAGYGMRAISGRIYDTVVIIGPSHRAYFEGAAIMSKGGYRTPLGMVDIDEGLAAAIVKEGVVVSENVGVHGAEHSLEVQIPFLQTVLSGFKIVPIIMGSQETDTCEKLAGNVYRGIKALGRRVLIVGSTDLSHYYGYDHAVTLDKHIVDRLEAFDIKGMADDFDAEISEACGRGPMIVTMMISKVLGATKSKVLKYANSGDVSGDKGNVVGYTSAVFYRTEGAKE